MRKKCQSERTEFCINYSSHFFLADEKFSLVMLGFKGSLGLIKLLRMYLNIIHQRNPHIDSGIQTQVFVGSELNPYHSINLSWQL
jgi:hypothetical protein